MAGDYSPHLDDVLLTNSHMDPTCSSLMEVADCGGTPLEEQPDKMAGVFRLFLQGLGYSKSINLPYIAKAQFSYSQFVFKYAC